MRVLARECTRCKRQLTRANTRVHPSDCLHHDGCQLTGDSVARSLVIPVCDDAKSWANALSSAPHSYVHSYPAKSHTHNDILRIAGALYMFMSAGVDTGQLVLGSLQNGA